MPQNDSQPQSFARRPFISYDGADGAGVRAEVKVSTGIAPIESMEENGKSLKVVFSAANTKYPVHASVRATDEKMVSLLREAQEAGEPVAFRIEVVRRNGVDRTTPFEELNKEAARTLYRNLAGVARAEDEGNQDAWVRSRDAVTNPAEDAQHSGNGTYSALNNPVPSPAQMPSAPSGQADNIVDPAPYVKYRRDGSVNLSGYAVNVPFNIFAYLGSVEGLEDADVEWRKHIATRLFKMAGSVQKHVYEGILHEADASLASHTKIRSIIFEVIRSVHSPLGYDGLIEDKEAENKWLTDVYNSTLEMWQWSMEVSGL